MKKNGFIATSILYSFFLVFISLFVLLIVSYVQNQNIVNKTNENVRNNLKKLDEMSVQKLQPGDRVRFQMNPNVYIDEKVIWTVGYTDDTKIYLFSDNKINQSYDSTDGTHSISIQYFLANKANIASSFKYNGITLEIPTVDILVKIKDSNKDDVIGTVFNYHGDFVINTGSNYALLRQYNFQSNDTSLVNNYCSGNIFNYKHTDLDANQSGEAQSYTDYCVSSTSAEYSHNYAGKVKEFTAHPRNDVIPNTTTLGVALDGSDYYTGISLDKDYIMYNLRYMGVIENTAPNSKVIGGRGTMTDPYIIGGTV